MRYLIAFMIGIIWELVLGFNTRMVAHGDNRYILFASTFTSSILWGYLIRFFVVSPNIVPIYALGTGFGVLIGVKISKKLK
jgi:uncharacterized protein YebE (UPF0316 family)